MVIWLCLVRAEERCRNHQGIHAGELHYGRSLIRQKSLVILTHLPLPALFMAVLETIAPIFFEHGYSALEAACHSIAAW